MRCYYVRFVPHFAHLVRVPDPLASAADDELRAHVERALAAHYELDCEIGRGGMGIVYRAKDRRLKRQVAIKLLPPELAFRSEIRSRFLREAETAAQLSHPNIVPIYTVDEPEGLVFFVMAYIAGDNLAKRLHERGRAHDRRDARRCCARWPTRSPTRTTAASCTATSSPTTSCSTQTPGRPMVTDFGIARAMDSEGDSRLTATGMAIGTPAYMSPEQAAGEREIDGRSDLYSLGVVAYQMLTGEPPFIASSTPAMLVKHISERPIPVEQRRTDVPAGPGARRDDAAREGSGEPLPDRGGARRRARHAGRCRHRARRREPPSRQRARRGAAAAETDGGRGRRTAHRPTVRDRRSPATLRRTRRRSGSPAGRRARPASAAARPTSCAAGRTRTSSRSAGSSRRTCSSTA